MSETYKPGRYRGRMNRVTLGASNDKGTTQIAFEFTPIGMHGADGLETCAADPRTIFRYLKDTTIDFVIQDLAALGYDRESFAEIDSDHTNAFPWAGIEFDCRLKYEEYKGKEKERWEFARGMQTGKPIEDKTIRELDAKYGAYLKGRSNGSQPAKKPVKQAAAPAPAHDDEQVPF